MHWRFLNTSYRSGAFNMRLDEELALRLFEGEAAGTVRVFGWSPCAVSLGWNQSFEEIDAERTRLAGVDVVRRPTGGRAILHAAEVTYSVTMISERSSVLAVYDEISRALVTAVRLLGADATLEKNQPHFPSVYRKASSVACFTSSARHEVKVGGRKLVGSAQRRYAGPEGKEAVLQHGSLLLGPEHRKIAEYLAVTDERRRPEILAELERTTTDLQAELGRTVTFEEAADAVRRGFEQAWRITFSEVISEPEGAVDAADGSLLTSLPAAIIP